MSGYDGFNWQQENRIGNIERELKNKAESYEIQNLKNEIARLKREISELKSEIDGLNQSINSFRSHYNLV